MLVKEHIVTCKDTAAAKMQTVELRNCLLGTTGENRQIKC